MEKEFDINNLKSDLLECACCSPEHSIRVHYDSEDKQVYLTVFLSNGRWYQRIYKAFKYIFGYKCKYGHFDEIILNNDSLQVIKNIENCIE